MADDGVGMPAHMLLNAWGVTLEQAFGHKPYLVGSATRSKQWRDVDVRMLLPDDEFDVLCGRSHPAVSPHSFVNPRWAALCTAVSLWGREVTGLPIDFQFQRATEANARYAHGRREPLGMVVAPAPSAEDATSDV